MDIVSTHSGMDRGLIMEPYNLMDHESAHLPRAMQKILRLTSEEWNNVHTSSTSKPETLSPPKILRKSHSELPSRSPTDQENISYTRREFSNLVNQQNYNNSSSSNTKGKGQTISHSATKRRSTSISAVRLNFDHLTVNERELTPNRSLEDDPIYPLNSSVPPTPAGTLRARSTSIENIYENHTKSFFKEVTERCAQKANSRKSSTNPSITTTTSTTTTTNTTTTTYNPIHNNQRVAQQQQQSNTTSYDNALNKSPRSLLAKQQSMPDMKKMNPLKKLLRSKSKTDPTDSIRIPDGYSDEIAQELELLQMEQFKEEQIFMKEKKQVENFLMENSSTPPMILSLLRGEDSDYIVWEEISTENSSSTTNSSSNYNSTKSSSSHTPQGSPSPLKKSSSKKQSIQSGDLLSHLMKVQQQANDQESEKLLRRIPKAGTLETILRWLIAENVEHSTLNCFLLTCRNFGVRPSEVFNCIEKIYRSIPKDVDVKVTTLFKQHAKLWSQKRVIRFLGIWLKTCTLEELSEEFSSTVEDCNSDEGEGQSEVSPPSSPSQDISCDCESPVSISSFGSDISDSDLAVPLLEKLSTFLSVLKEDGFTYDTRPLAVIIQKARNFNKDLVKSPVPTSPTRSSSPDCRLLKTRSASVPALSPASKFRLVKLSTAQPVAFNPKQQQQLHFSRFSPSKVASQLHLIEMKMFRKISVSTELANVGWSKAESAKYTSPHVISMIDRFNRVSYWVATEVLSCETDKQQASTIQRFIAVASECRSRGNFNSLMEIIAGLNMYVVQGLTSAWENVSDKYVNTMKELEEFMSSNNNYRNYRKELTRLAEVASRNPTRLQFPILPYLGVYLRDILFCDEGNANRIGEKKLLNFGKMRMLGAIFSEIQQHQLSPQMNHLEQDEDPIVYNYLINLVIMDEESLYNCLKKHKRD